MCDLSELYIYKLSEEYMFTGHPILQILESRTTDKLAMDFVKKQRLRFAEQ